MNYFPNGDEEINLIKFLAIFQYLNVSDINYFFSSKKYFRKRISSLISKKFLKKIKSNLVLDEVGIEYVKLFNFEYIRRNRNQEYIPRLLLISNLGAFYNNCNLVLFTPSFLIKDKAIFTTTARRFIGILEINHFDYLTYKILSNQDNKYITSVIYDIQKEKKYKNIIIFIDDLSRININDFAFGMNSVLLIEDSIENREKLKYLHSINWSKVIQKYYKNNVYISEYSFCDYTDYKNTYISYFYFLDTEKIIRIKQFLRENQNKQIEIICSKSLKEELQKELPSAKYLTIDLEEFIDKEIKYYD